MKNKFLTFMLLVCFMVPCAFLFVACGEQPPEVTYVKAWVSIAGGEKYTSTGVSSVYGENPYNDTDLAFYREMSDGTFVSAETNDFSFSITDSQGNTANADRLNFRQLSPNQTYTAIYTDTQDNTKSVTISITVEKAVQTYSFTKQSQENTFSYPNMPTFNNISGLTVDEDYYINYIKGTSEQITANGYTNSDVGTNQSNPLLSDQILTPGTYCFYASVNATDFYKQYNTNLIEITITKGDLVADESVIAEKFGHNYALFATSTYPVTLQDIATSSYFGTLGTEVAVKNSKGQQINGTFTFSPALLQTVIYADATTRYFDATFVPEKVYAGLDAEQNAIYEDGYNSITVSIPVTLTYTTLSTPTPVASAMLYTGSAHTVGNNAENLELFDIYYIDNQGQKITINGLNPDIDQTQLPDLVDKNAILPGTYRYRLAIKNGAEKYFKLADSETYFDFEYTITPLDNQIAYEASETFPFVKQLTNGQQNVFEIKLQTNQSQIDIDTLTVTKANPSLQYAVEIDKTKCQQLTGQGGNPDTTLIVVKITVEDAQIATLLNSQPSVEIQIQIDGTSIRAGYKTLPSNQYITLLAPIAESDANSVTEEVWQTQLALTTVTNVEITTTTSSVTAIYAIDGEIYRMAQDMASYGMYMEFIASKTSTGFDAYLRQSKDGEFSYQTAAADDSDITNVPVQINNSLELLRALSSCYSTAEYSKTEKQYTITQASTTITGLGEVTNLVYKLNFQDGVLMSADISFDGGSVSYVFNSVEITIPQVA